MAEKSPYVDDEKTFLYDLRQRREKIIGECIEAAVNSMASRSYFYTYDNLQNLYVVCEHMFKDKDKIFKEYNRMLKIIEENAEKYEETWNSPPQNQDKTEAAIIMDSLRNLLGT